MRKHVDAIYVANSIRLYRQAAKRTTVLLLEGSDDVRLFDKFINAEHCKTFNAFGKTNVIESVLALEEDGYNGVCGIVDADFDAILNVDHGSDNILVLRYHDLDLMLFYSKALDVYIGFVGDEAKLNRLGNPWREVLQKRIFSCARVLGAARLVASRDGLDIFFKDLEYHTLVDQETLAISGGIYEHLVERSDTACNAPKLKTLTENEMAKEHPDEMLCQGHDVAAILGIALREMIGNRKIAQTFGSEIELALRMTFDLQSFSATDLASDIRKWEQQNPGWRILLA